MERDVLALTWLLLLVAEPTAPTAVDMSALTPAV